MALEWFTYAALGERLGISPEAVRQRAIRHEWTKRTGNDGKAEVRVDAEELVAAQAVRPPSDAGPTPEPPAIDPPADARILDSLDAHIASLRAIVERADLQAERERERAVEERARADVERRRADTERDRADGIAAELAQVRSDGAEQVAGVERRVAELRQVVEAMKAPAAETRVREAALEARIDAVRAEATALRDRPWWRRLAG